MLNSNLHFSLRKQNMIKTSKYDDDDHKKNHKIEVEINLWSFHQISRILHR